MMMFCRSPAREIPTFPLEMQEQLISSTSSSEDENDGLQLTINEHYAKAFQYRKEREELVKRARPHSFSSITSSPTNFFILSPAVKEKYGSDADTDDLSSEESDSESDESEDEDGEELTPALDAAILRTLARIKARDPGIYDAGRNVFEGAPSRSRIPLRRFLRMLFSIGDGGR
jgi:protein KRI1